MKLFDKLFGKKDLDPAKVEEKPVVLARGYLINAESNNAFIAVNELLKAKEKVF
jgi:hypothetical protein